MRSMTCATSATLRFRSAASACTRAPSRSARPASSITPSTRLMLHPEDPGGPLANALVIGSCMGVSRRFLCQLTTGSPPPPEAVFFAFGPWEVVQVPGVQLVGVQAERRDDGEVVTLIVEL